MLALSKVFLEKDASLAEINPLAVTKKGDVVVLDAKIDFDDNALFRHKDVEALRDLAEENPAEIRAGKANLNYIQLDGNIGCLVNGAGLAMATMDIIKHHGGNPANFLDVGGGVTAESAIEAFRIILSDPKVKGVLVNIFGGIAKCDLIAEALVKAGREVGFKVPVVVRLEGTNVEKAREILDGRQGRAADDPGGRRADRGGEDGGRSWRSSREALTMRRDDILRRLQEHPFRPFQVRLSNGTIHLIQHPELAMVGGSSIVIGIPRTGYSGPGDIDDHMVVSLGTSCRSTRCPLCRARGRQHRRRVTATRTEADMATVHPEDDR